MRNFPLNILTYIQGILSITLVCYEVKKWLVVRWDLSIHKFHINLLTYFNLSFLKSMDHQIYIFLPLFVLCSIQFDTISTNVISSKKGILRSELRNSIPTGMHSVLSTIPCASCYKLLWFQCCSLWRAFLCPRRPAMI